MRRLSRFVSSRGQVLPLAVVCLLVLLIMVPLMVSYTQTEAKWSVKEAQSTQAMHLAEAGIEKGYLKISVSTLTWVSLQAGGATAAGVLTNYSFDKAYSDVGSGTYAISVTSGPGVQQATIISVGRDALRKETRAIKAVYSNSPMGGIAIYAGKGADIGGGFTVEWGGIVSPNVVTAPAGALHPQFWSASSIVNFDTDPNPPNCDTPNCCQWHSFYAGLPPAATLDLGFYASSAAASDCSLVTGILPGVATPVGSCYYAVDQQFKSVSVTGKTIYVNGTLTVKAPGIDIVGTLIVTGDLSLPIGQWGYGTHTMAIPSDAWKQYCNDWAAYKVFDPAVPYAAFPGLNASYAPTGLTLAGTGKQAVTGLLYVGGNAGAGGGGGGTDVYGSLFAVGSASSTASSPGTFYYNSAATSGLQTTTIVLSRASWQDVNNGWPSGLP